MIFNPCWMVEEHIFFSEDAVSQLLIGGLGPGGLDSGLVKRSVT